MCMSLITSSVFANTFYIVNRSFSGTKCTVETKTTIQIKRSVKAQKVSTALPKESVGNY